jgi:hypothetical protein
MAAAGQFRPPDRVRAAPCVPRSASTPGESPMRLLLQYKTADPKHPHTDVHPDDLRTMLGGLGWLPTDEYFAKDKLDAVIQRMPDTIRSQIAGANPILVTTRPGTWGIVSMENRNRIFVRLLHDDLATLRGEAEEVVTKFPEGFEAEFGRDLGFEPEVVIRRFDTEARMVAGEIQLLRNYGLWRYARELRRRELWTFLALAALTVVSVAGSLLMFATHVPANLDYYRGYLDRTGTALLTASLTTIVNLIFEYRAWRNLKVRIKWAFQ